MAGHSSYSLNLRVLSPIQSNLNPNPISMNDKKPFDDNPKTCKVCQLSVEELDEKYTSEGVGDVFSFCSRECYDDFLKNPEEYADGKEEAE